MEMQWYSKFNPYATTWCVLQLLSSYGADLGLILSVSGSVGHMHVTRVNE